MIKLCIYEIVVLKYNLSFYIVPNEKKKKNQNEHTRVSLYILSKIE